mgnify:CR=1 FL=1
MVFAYNSISKGELSTMLKSYIAFDIETTGLDPTENEIIEIGALKVREGKVADRFIEFLRPLSPISPAITSLTGITDEMVADAREGSHVVRDFLDFCGDDVLIGHNVIFDYSFVKCSAAKDGLPFEKKGIDTLKIAKKVLAHLESKSLGTLCEHYISRTNPPTALITTLLPRPSSTRRSPTTTRRTSRSCSGPRSLHIRCGNPSLQLRSSSLSWRTSCAKEAYARNGRRRH